MLKSQVSKRPAPWGGKFKKEKERRRNHLSFTLREKQTEQLMGLPGTAPGAYHELGPRRALSLAVACCSLWLWPTNPRCSGGRKAVNSDLIFNRKGSIMMLEEALLENSAPSYWGHTSGKSTLPELIKLAANVITNHSTAKCSGTHAGVRLGLICPGTWCYRSWDSSRAPSQPSPPTPRWGWSALSPLHSFVFSPSALCFPFTTGPDLPFENWASAPKKPRNPGGTGGRWQTAEAHTCPISCTYSPSQSPPRDWRAVSPPMALPVVSEPLGKD